MKEKELKKLLLAWETPTEKSEKIEEAKRSAFQIKIRVTLKTVSPIGFLKSIFPFVRPSFYIVNTLYLILAFVASYIYGDESSLLVICGITPFLMVAAMPTLFYFGSLSSMELESSCFISPKTVLAGKLSICFMLDFICTLICFLFLSVFSSVKPLCSFVGILFSYTTSAIISFGVSFFFKNQTAMIVSVGLFSVIAGIVLSQNYASNFTIEKYIDTLIYLLPCAVILLIAVLNLTIKKYDYERQCVKIGT